MTLILIFLAKIVLTLPCNPYDSTGTACNSSKYMVDGKVCAPICPTLFTPYQLNCPSCENYCSKPATANDAILFTLELSAIQDLTLTYAADSLDSGKKFENPGGISYNSATRNSPLPTLDRGFYFASTSSMIGNQSYIPGIYFLLNLWIKPLASGEILNVQISATTYMRIWADATNVYKFTALIYSSSGAQVSVTGASGPHNSSWQRASMLLNQQGCTQIYIIFYLNNALSMSTPLTNYEIIFPNESYTWTFGNISVGNSFNGFIYWLQARADYNAVYGTMTSTVNCAYNQYISSSTCMDCDINCPTWPWCISGTTCSICLLSDCNSCTGYYPLGCSSCSTGVPPYCCDHLGTACTQTWTNTACSTGVPNNAGVCLYGLPYGWSNCGGNSCFAVLTVDFTVSFAGIYASVFTTGTSSSSYNYWNSPETPDPFPVKNRGLYFNSNQFLSGAINLSNTWSMGMWVYAISGTIISHSTNKLTISSSGTINFDLEKWDGNYASYSASNFIALNLWIYISYSVGFANKATTLTPYANTAPGTVVTVTDYVFRLPDSEILYIGKGSPSFNGFISYFQLWGTTITDFSVPYNLYGFSGGAVSTLWPCDYSHYYDGSVCQSCPGSCTMGCTRGTSCYICDDFLCSQCSSFLANTCTACISDASGTPCQCNPGFYQPTSQALCSACYTGCQTCTGSGYYQCTSCKSGFYFLTLQCLVQCPWGYLPNSSTNSCIFSSLTYGLSFNNNILLNTISGVNVGSLNTNSYPIYDPNDPYPAYLRGCYFNYNTYLKTNFMLAPSFSIGIWIKPTGAGLVITKYVSTTQWFVQILPSGYPKLSLLLSDTLTTISVIGTTNMLNQLWYFIAFDCQINTNGKTTIKTWVDGVNLIAATTATALFLLDSQSGSMYIGHYDLGFSGFLWTLKIYCQNSNALADFTTVGCNSGCTKCPANLVCLNDCPLSEYFNGSACTSCRPTCTQGCRNSDTCRLCKTKECATCTSFTGANSCLTCITNAVFDGTGGCTCAPNSLWIYSTEICDICDAPCSLCLKTTYFECSSCAGSYQLVGNVCLNGCPYGYGPSCSQVSSAVIDQSFIGDFQGSYGIFTTGASSLSYYFFATPESSDPIPAYKRGLYFDGAMLLTSSNILISHSFSIGAWIYVITDGYWFQKQFLLALSTTVTITANMEDPTQSSETHALSSSTAFSGWTYVAVTFSYTYGVTNLEIYISGNSAATISVTNRVFRDNATRSLWIGRSSSSGFVGFIYSFQLWNVPISDFTSYINSLCESGTACLWSCDLSHYYDGTNYLTCNSCTEGCVRASTCNICNDLLCSICTGFDSGKCTQCVLNASGAPNQCVCNIGYGTSPDGFSCIACYSGCAHCTDTTYQKCTSCLSGLYLYAGQCLTECPSGYTANSGTNACDYVSGLGLVLDLTDQIRLDQVSSFDVGFDNTNTYPNWSDAKDPVPAYKRGYYFYHNRYMTSTVMIAPSFTISIWAKPIGAGILMAKYTSSDILKINVDSSGYPELTILFKDLSLSVVTTNISILNSWHFLSFTGQMQSDGKTLLILYINNVASPGGSVTTTSLTYFKDTNSGTLYVGNDETLGSLGLYGFLAQLKIYNSYNHQSDDFATYLCGTGCSYCPANYQCLSECDFDKYPDSCTACTGCSQGCVSGFTCGLCRDKECYSCTTFSGECINCIANAYKVAGHCKCLDNAVWVSSSRTCEFCDSICLACSTVKFDGCLTCASGNYLIQSLCIPFCPTGYIINGSNCNSNPAYTNFFVFNLMPHQIKNVVVDLKSNIPVLTGKDNKFYPAYDPTDPIPAIYRGYYFSGSAYMQLPPYTGTSSPLFIFAPKFTISAWIKPLTSTGVIFSKQANSGLFKKFISLELINKTPSLILTLKDSSTITYTSSNPLLEATLSQWNFISAISTISSTPQQTISLSMNGNIDLSIDLCPSWLNDLENSFTITLGACYTTPASLTSFFNGFLWDLKIYNTPIAAISLTSSSCSGCSLCPIDNDNKCLDSCLLDGYWNGNNCISCSTGCINVGCVRSDKNCNLCNDVICEICDDYTVTCITCKTHANLIGTSCQCSSGYYWNYSNEICELCDISCKTCTSPSSLDCLTCANGYYSFSGICVASCPPGYSPSSNECVLAKEKIFDLDLNTLNGVIYDKASSIPVITGSTKQFYPNYEADDPIPAYLRGFWFNGQSSLLRLPEYSSYTSPRLVIASTFTISIWLNIENSSSSLLSKYSLSNNYSTLYSISLLSSKPTISLLINSSPFFYICQASLNYYEWSHLELKLEASNGHNLLTCYINGKLDSSAMTGYGTFNDIGPQTTMTIGAQISSSAVYNFYQGFIYTIQIFNIAKPISSLSTTSCTESCTVCPISQICIPNCRINEYWSGPAYNLCYICNAKCSTTCKDWRNTCSLCDNLLCDYCTDYSASGCETCKENAINPDSCICDINYVLDSSNNNTCIPVSSGGFRGPDGIFYPCPNLCTDCESLTKCTACVENASLKNDLCYCNLGYNGMKNCNLASFSVSLKVLSDNSLYLYFTESLAKNLTISDFTIEIKGQGKVSCKIEQVNSTCYYISLSISKEIVKGTLATLKFLNLYDVRSVSNGVLNSSEISAALNFYDPAPYSSAVSTVASQAKAATLVAVSGAVALSVLNPSPSSLWSMMNALQILSYLTLSGIPLSSKISSFLNNLNNYNLFPNIFQYFIDKNAGNTPYSKAEEFGYESDLILINTGNDFTLLLVSISAFPIIYFFSRCSYRWIGKKFRKTVQAYQFAFYLRFWIQCYLELGAAAAIGFLTTGFNNITKFNNFIICLVISVILILTPPAFFLFSYKNKNRIQSREKTFLASFSSLFYEFRTDRGLLATQYYCVFFLRRLIYIINLVYLRDFPQTEVTINIVLSLMVIMHLWFFWPFEDQILQVSNLLTEILIFLVMSTTSVYLFDLDQSIVSVVENAIIAIVIAAIGIQAIASIAIFGKTLYGIIKNRLIKSGIIKNSAAKYKQQKVKE